MTLDRSTVFYNILTGVWEIKEAFEPIDLMEVESKVFKIYKVKSRDELIQTLMEIYKYGKLVSS